MFLTHFTHSLHSSMSKRRGNPFWAYCTSSQPQTPNKAAAVDTDPAPSTCCYLRCRVAQGEHSALVCFELRRPTLG